MLHGKQRQQAQVDRERRAEGHVARGIHGFGDREVADEADGVQEHGEEHGIAGHAVEQHEGAFHVIDSLRGLF